MCDSISAQVSHIYLIISSFLFLFRHFIITNFNSLLHLLAGIPPKLPKLIILKNVSSHTPWVHTCHHTGNLNQTVKVQSDSTTRFTDEWITLQDCSVLAGKKYVQICPNFENYHLPPLHPETYSATLIVLYGTCSKHAF